MIIRPHHNRSRVLFFSDWTVPSSILIRSTRGTVFFPLRIFSFSHFFDASSKVQTHNIDDTMATLIDLLSSSASADRRFLFIFDRSIMAGKCQSLVRHLYQWWKLTTTDWRPAIQSKKQREDGPDLKQLLKRRRHDLFFQLNSLGYRRKEKSIITAVNYSSSSLNLESGEEWKTRTEIDNYEESDHLTWTRPVGPFIRHLFRFNRLFRNEMFNHRSKMNEWLSIFYIVKFSLAAKRKERH